MIPYIAFGKKSFMLKSAYRFDHFMGILNTLVRIFIFWEIYKVLYGVNTEVDGITGRLHGRFHRENQRNAP